jgi:hypothetical protein
MLGALWTREHTISSNTAIANFCSHIGFEELAMRNIDAVLKGGEPLTPVNKHLLNKNGQAKL